MSSERTAFERLELLSSAYPGEAWGITPGELFSPSKAREHEYTQRLKQALAEHPPGKTALLLALIGAWRRGEPSFLGHRLVGPCLPVLIVGTDQPQSDWGRMLREVGLLGEGGEILPPIVALFHKGKPLHLDCEGIERIATYAAKHPGLLILLDSISACTSPLGLDENSPEIVEPINDLMEAISPHGATLVAIHHSSKGRQGEAASMASRGSTALPAAASQGFPGQAREPSCRPSRAPRAAENGREGGGGKSKQTKQSPRFVLILFLIRPPLAPCPSQLQKLTNSQKLSKVTIIPAADPSKGSGGHACEPPDVEGRFSTFDPELLGVRTERYGDFVLGQVGRDSLEDALTTGAYQHIAAEMAAGVEECGAPASTSRSAVAGRAATSTGRRAPWRPAKPRSAAGG